MQAERDVSPFDELPTFELDVLLREERDHPALAELHGAELHLLEEAPLGGVAVPLHETRDPLLAQARPLVATQVEVWSLCRGHDVAAGQGVQRGVTQLLVTGLRRSRCWTPSTRAGFRNLCCRDPWLSNQGCRDSLAVGMARHGDSLLCLCSSYLVRLEPLERQASEKDSRDRKRSLRNAPDGTSALEFTHTLG